MNELHRMIIHAAHIAREREMYDYDQCEAISMVLEAMPARDTWERQARADEYTPVIADVCASLIKMRGQ